MRHSEPSLTVGLLILIFDCRFSRTCLMLRLTTRGPRLFFRLGVIHRMAGGANGLRIVLMIDPRDRFALFRREDFIVFEFSANS